MSLQKPLVVIALQNLSARDFWRLLVLSVLVAACSSGNNNGHIAVGATSTTSSTGEMQRGWTAYPLPPAFADRALAAYAQVDDAHALVYGGAVARGDDFLVANDGIIIDLETGAVTDVPGPQVEGGLARASAATETDSARVAIAGLQCASPTEDETYLAEDDRVDACSPGPVTVSVYDSAQSEWSDPSEAPYDYGQSFVPNIIGFVDGRVYIWVHVFDPPGLAPSDFISLDTRTGTWSRIAHPPGNVSPCLGESQVVGIVYDGQSHFSDPAVVTYDSSKDSWSRHPVPNMKNSEYPYGRGCTENWIIVMENRTREPDIYEAYSMVDGSWTVLPSPPVNQLLGVLHESAGDTLVTWNVADLPGSVDTTPVSLVIGAAAWTQAVSLPIEEDTSSDVLTPHAHAGTRIVSFAKDEVLTADVRHLAVGSTK